MKRWKIFKEGIKAGLPVIIGYIPIGIAYGMMASDANTSLSLTMALSLFVYTGAGQMAAINMLHTGATIFAIILTTFILNLRHVIMSTCVMDRLTDGNKLERALLSFFITDEVFALYVSDEKSKNDIWYFFGLALTCWLSWAVGSFIGALTTHLLPAVLSASLGISLYAMFIALVIPSVKKHRKLIWVILLTCILSWIFNQWFSSSWAMIAATLISAFIGLSFIDLEDLS